MSHHCLCAAAEVPQQQLTVAHMLAQPSMTIPTAIGTSNYANKPAYKSTGLEDLDFHIGHDAISNSATYPVTYPVRHGMVSNSFQMVVLYTVGKWQV